MHPSVYTLYNTLCIIYNRSNLCFMVPQLVNSMSNLIMYYFVYEIPKCVNFVISCIMCIIGIHKINTITLYLFTSMCYLHISYEYIHTFIISQLPL